MKRIWFTHVQVFDGSGAPPYAAEVLIEDDRIAAVNRGHSRTAASDKAATLVDGRGATLMPGLIEAHAHLSWPTSVERFVPGMHLPPDDLVLNTARNARVLLDHGFTGAYSGGALARTVEIALKAAIDSGGMPGPRLVPSSIEREPPSSNELVKTGSIEEHGTGPEAIRAFVKSCAQLGAKSVKFLLSGESALKPGASMQLMYSEEEIRAAGEQARESGVWLTGHAHAPEAIKMGVRHGFRILYHCTYADAEAIEMLAAKKDEMFVAPTIGIAQATLDAQPPPHMDMTHMKNDAQSVIDHQRKLMPELKRRGVRLLPGGDYGFPFNPNGRNARDLELFVRHFGYTPTEALLAATRLAAQLLGMGDELGQVRAGCLADLLLVDGDPTRDVSILQNKTRLLGIMKGGSFHKAPVAAH